MAILLVKSKIEIITIILVILLCPASYTIAAETGPTSAPPSTTQATAEVFDIKEKDVPAVSNSDIPLPDFKEFEDDNLLEEEGKAPPKSTPVTETKTENNKTPSQAIGPNVPTTPAVPSENSKPADVITNLPSGSEIAKPVVETDKATPKAEPSLQELETKPTIPATEADASKKDETAQPTLATQDSATTTDPAETNTNSQNPDILTDDELAVYAELKKHLLSFVENFREKAPLTATTETPVVAKPLDEVAEVDSTLPLPAIDAAKPETSPKVEVPTPDAKTAEILAPPQDTTKVAVVDELEDLLGPKKELSATVVAASKPITPAAEEKKIEVPAPKIKIESEVTAKVSAPTTPEIKSPEPAPASTTTKPAKTTANVGHIAQTPAKPKEIILPDQAEVKPVEIKEKPSEADKAYFKLLDKKQDELPDNKRLSSSSKDTIEEVSSALAPVKKTAKKELKHIKVERGGDSVKPEVSEDGVIKSKNKMDLSIRKIGKNEDFEKSKVKLEKAYKALLIGQISAAISIYKDILEKEPKNKDAMFGLATSYHKNNQFEQARSIYTTLLNKEPSNKEALNNFLVLVAEEAPEDALIELEKLERINSDFSPIPAQIAMINLKLGDTEKAARYLRRAILLSPDNLSYKYNLAIIYDKLGKEEQAVQLYHQIIESARAGVIIPGSIDKLIERATYLERKISEKK